MTGILFVRALFIATQTDLSKETALLVLVSQMLRTIAADIIIPLTGCQCVGFTISLFQLFMYTYRYHF